MWLLKSETVEQPSLKKELHLRPQKLSPMTPARALKMSLIGLISLTMLTQPTAQSLAALSKVKDVVLPTLMDNLQ